MKHTKPLTRWNAVYTEMPAHAQDLLLKETRIGVFSETVGLLTDIVSLIGDILSLRQE